MMTDSATYHRIANLKSQYPTFAFLLRCTSNYGQSLRQWTLCVITAVIVFSLIYSIFPNMISETGFFDAVYFSAATFTALGFGDIVPLTMAGKVLVVVEAGFGYFMWGLLIAIIAQRLIGN
jgi:hypothetical protein